MKGHYMYILLVLTLLSLTFGAPVEVKGDFNWSLNDTEIEQAIEEMIANRTEITKEILENLVQSKDQNVIIEDFRTVEDPDEIEAVMGHPSDIKGMFSPIPLFPPEFRFYDKDGDSRILLEELVAITGAAENVKAAFRDTDTDGDGAVSEHEFNLKPWGFDATHDTIVDDDVGEDNNDDVTVDGVIGNGDVDVENHVTENTSDVESSKHSQTAHGDGKHNIEERTKQTQEEEDDTGDDTVS